MFAGLKRFSLFSPGKLIVWNNFHKIVFTFISNIFSVNLINSTKNGCPFFFTTSVCIGQLNSADIDWPWCIDDSCIVYMQQLQTVLYLDMCRVWRDVYWLTYCQVSGVYIVGWFKTGRVLSALVLKIVFLMDTLLLVHG